MILLYKCRVRLRGAQQVECGQMARAHAQQKKSNKEQNHSPRFGLLKKSEMPGWIPRCGGREPIALVYLDRRPPIAGTRRRIGTIQRSLVGTAKRREPMKSDDVHLEYRWRESNDIFGQSWPPGWMIFLGKVIITICCPRHGVGECRVRLPRVSTYFLDFWHVDVM